MNDDGKQKRGKRDLYVLISLTVEDLSFLCACCCYISVHCGQFGRLTMTVLIQTTLLVFISAVKMFIITIWTYLVILMKEYDNRWAQLCLKRSTNGYGQSSKSTLAILILCIQGFYCWKLVNKYNYFNHYIFFYCNRL